VQIRQKSFRSPFCIIRSCSKWAFYLMATVATASCCPCPKQLSPSTSISRFKWSQSKTYSGLSTWTNCILSAQNWLSVRPCPHFIIQINVHRPLVCGALPLYNISHLPLHANARTSSADRSYSTFPCRLQCGSPMVRHGVPFKNWGQRVTSPGSNDVGQFELFNMPQ
jgi:hypothetical protein